jgi:hypothetical protein
MKNLPTKQFVLLERKIDEAQSHQLIQTSSLKEEDLNLYEYSHAIGENIEVWVKK